MATALREAAKKARAHLLFENRSKLYRIMSAGGTQILHTGNSAGIACHRRVCGLIMQHVRGCSAGLTRCGVDNDTMVFGRGLCASAQGMIGVFAARCGLAWAGSAVYEGRKRVSG